MNQNGWYNSDALVKGMIESSLGLNPDFVRLENTDHFKVLNSIISSINISSIVELGCGSGDISRVFYNKYKYLGGDLSHIIENVSKLVNPQGEYFSFDANKNTDLSIVKNYDLLLMCGFLSELQEPLVFLERIINYQLPYILIHRQEFSHKSYLEKYKTYGEIEVTKSYINFSDFLNLIDGKYIIISNQTSAIYKEFNQSEVLIGNKRPRIVNKKSSQSTVLLKIKN